MLKEDKNNGHSEPLIYISGFQNSSYLITGVRTGTASLPYNRTNTFTWQEVVFHSIKLVPELRRVIYNEFPARDSLLQHTRKYEYQRLNSRRLRVRMVGMVEKDLNLQILRSPPILDIDRAGKMTKCGVLARRKATGILRGHRRQQESRQNPGSSGL
jgi:hypothetical protein